MDQDVMRATAEKQPSESAKAARPGDDEIGSPFGCRGFDLSGSVAAANGAVGMPAASHQPRRHLIDHDAMTVDLVGHIQEERSTGRQSGQEERRVAIAGWCCDAQDIDRRVAEHPPSQQHSRNGLGALRAVGGNQDSIDMRLTGHQDRAWGMVDECR